MYYILEETFPTLFANDQKAKQPNDYLLLLTAVLIHQQNLYEHTQRHNIKGSETLESFRFLFFLLF